MTDDNRRRIEELSHKSLLGTMTDTEKRELGDWLNIVDESPLEIPVKVATSKEQYGEQIFQGISERIGTVFKSRQEKLWPRIVAAASIVLVIMAVGYYAYQSESVNQKSAIVYSNDVAPGKQGATLTLANGKKIRLGDAVNGEIAKEAGVVVSKTADGQIVYEVVKSSTGGQKMVNTLSTAKGETYQVKLPDGSVIWLNAASSITYAASLLENGERKIRLQGEGYFEVAKDKLHPFIVESDDQQIEVLGTHFNVNSYADEGSIKTTLLEGSVLVNQEVVLKPNQQSVLLRRARKGLGLSGSNHIEVKQVDVSTAIDWKNGDFIFKRESLEQIMRKVARWYDVQISYDADVDVSQTFSGLVSRSKNISQVLLSMESTGRLKFKINGKRVYVSK